MHYVKTKRAKVGRCNICLEEKSLSWDHIPPKGGISLTTMEMQSLFRIFTGNEKPRIRESQNGLKFRTICKECNELLGQKYDNVVNEFATSVGNYLKSNLKFPKIIHHKTKPKRLMKGILGHIVAGKIEIDECLFDEKVREVILDEEADIPEELNIFYWIYPYDSIVLMRDFVMLAVRGSFDEIGFFQVFKYFPMAYLVANKPRYEGLYELTKYRQCDIDDEIEIPLQLDVIKHRFWPEMVDSGNMVAGGQAITNAVSATPKK